MVKLDGELVDLACRILQVVDEKYRLEDSRFRALFVDNRFSKPYLFR